MSKYSFETTVGELLDTAETRAIIEELAPELLEHPLLKWAEPSSLSMPSPILKT